jgi:hypothetical protein
MVTPARVPGLTVHHTRPGCRPPRSGIEFHNNVHTGRIQILPDIRVTQTHNQNKKKLETMQRLGYTGS